jgi:hypothetical protein
MIGVNIEIDDKITGQVDKIKLQLQLVPKEAYREFVSLTPMRSGNARRNTSLQGNQIQANYPYAQRLDEGWSKQAPRGMIEPWTKWLENRIKQIMGR